MADDKDQKHPRWEQIKELHQIWKDTWYGFECGVVDALPLEDDGWENSPWEAPLSQLIDFREG
jgi:hypothetical protein